MTHTERIQLLNNELKGRKVEFHGVVYNIALVDCNGIVHIDRPTIYNKTTAVYYPSEARKHLV